MIEAATQELSYNGRALQWRDLRELGTNDGRFAAGLVTQHIRESMTPAIRDECWSIARGLLAGQESRLAGAGCSPEQVKAYARAFIRVLERVRKAIK